MSVYLKCYNEWKHPEKLKSTVYVNIKHLLKAYFVNFGYLNLSLLFDVMTAIKVLKNVYKFPFCRNNLVEIKQNSKLTELATYLYIRF